jgi:endoglucanase
MPRSKSHAVSPRPAMRRSTSSQSPQCRRRPVSTARARLRFHSTDVPGGNPKTFGKVDLGGGAAITRGPVVHPIVSDTLADVAASEGIDHCFEVYSAHTQTDADAIFVARGGVPTGLVSIPLRYMHSPCELCSLDDLEAVIALTTAFARRLTRETSFLR